MLNNEHATFLAKRAIDTKTASDNQFETVSAAAAANELGMVGGVAGDAIRIPYMNIDGSPFINEDGTQHVRFRVIDARTDNELAGKKRQRYIGRSGAGAMPYIPYDAAQLSAIGAPFIVVTEGEFKAAAATSIGIPTIAIPGVTMWSDGVGSLGADSAIDGEILDAIDAMCAAGVIVLADSDASENILVSNAMNAFTGALKCALDIPVMYARVPAKVTQEGRKKISEKQGLDDWIVNAGTENVRGLLNHTWNTEMKRIKAKSGGGYEALGYKDRTNYVWSISKNQVYALAGKDSTSPAELMNIVGGYDYCVAEYGETSPKTATTTVNFTRMGGDLISRCDKAGIFNTDMLCGSGVWMNVNGGISINSAEHFWNADGTAADRVKNEDDRIYQASISLGITPDSEVGTAEDAKFVFDGMGTWNFRSVSDRTLMFGWLMLSYLAAAAPWRPHASLTAPAGSGKTTLQNAFANLLGKACIYLEGSQSTAIGIMQGLNQDAIAVIVGEAESDTEKAAQKTKDLLVFLRSCSDGAVGDKGTQTHDRKRFVLRSMGMVAGITPPNMTPADESRFLCIEIDPLAEGQEIHLLASREALDKKEVQKIGRRLFMRMINSWQRLVAAEKVIRKCMAGSSRFLDTFTPIVAASWVAMNEGELSEIEAKALVKSIEFDEQKNRINDAMTSGNAIDTLMAAHFFVDGNMHTVATAVAEAIHEEQAGRLGRYQNALGLYGLKVDTPYEKNGKNIVRHIGKERLFIHPESALQLVKTMFLDTKSLKHSLKIAGAKTVKTSQSISSVSRRCVEIPLSNKQTESLSAANDEEYNSNSNVSVMNAK